MTWCYGPFQVCFGARCSLSQDISSCLDSGQIPLQDKQYMASGEFSNTFLLYPRRLALERLPVGLPVGRSRDQSLLDSRVYLIELFVFHSVQMAVESIHNTDAMLFNRTTNGTIFGVCFGAGLASKREIAADMVINIEKYLPALRDPLFSLNKGADWLENWVRGTLPRGDLLDVSAFGSQFVDCVGVNRKFSAKCNAAYTLYEDFFCEVHDYDRAQTDYFPCHFTNARCVCD